MNGMKPDYVKTSMGESYYKEPNPYVDAPSCNVNLLEMSRYAKRVGKMISELTREEVEQFKIV